MMELVCDEGLLGFEDVHNYRLVKAEEPGPFMWLEAVGKDIRFIVADPKLFWEDYRPEIPGEVLKGIGIDSISDAKLYVIVTVPSDPLWATGNCFAPVVINEKSGQMRQALLRDSDYPLSAYLFPEGVRIGKAGMVSAGPNSPQR
ncbi:MAG: flagellar assembly protein FliW [Firmicutes bacterium]|jgi:flagellar assembly factor FliW|nr:flagellar assembly protein FliW [Bacillota bacterium]